MRWLALFFCLVASTANGQIIQDNGLYGAWTASPLLSFTSLANGTVGGSPIAGSGSYSGTAPSSISAATWGGGCSGSSTPAGFSASGGTWSATFTVPGSSGTGCTIAITDNRSDTATSPGVTISAGAYTGVLDIVPSATACYSLRSCSAAFATGSNNAINVRRVSDNSTRNIVILSNGNLDISTANTFATQDATCTSASAVGTTSLVLTGCTSAVTNTIHGSSTITGTVSTGSIVQPAFIAASNCTLSGGAGTCTMANAQTFTLSAITFQYGLFITEFYDQTGNGANQVQATAGSQAQLLPVGSNSLPAAYGAGSKFYTQTIAALVQPLTISAVAERTANFTSNSNIMGGANGCAFNTSANQVFCYFGTLREVAASDSVLHALAFAISGASSAFYVDGSASSPGTPGAGSMSANWQIFAQSSGLDSLTGIIDEAVVWPSLLNATQAGNIRTNQKAYWGTP